VTFCATALGAAASTKTTHVANAVNPFDVISIPSAKKMCD
jgi:hypothetical protein